MTHEDLENYVIKVKHSLADRLPWPLSTRIQLLAHEKFVEEFGENWTIKETAKLLNKTEFEIKSSIKLGTMLKMYPNLAKITNRRRVWRIVRIWRDAPTDTFRLKVEQAIQNQVNHERRTTYDELAKDLNELTI